MFSPTKMAARVAVLLSALALTSCRDQSPEPVIQPTDPPAIGTLAIMTHLSRLADDSMFGRGPGTPDELRAANYVRAQFQAFGLQAPTSGALQPFTNSSVSSQNVIGILPGRGNLQNEWIVLGAHYDHTGSRMVGGTRVVYNGADDNASGTSGLLAMAQQAATYIQSGGSGTVPRRSLMFIAFGSEELGLMGSNYYCEHPLHPLNTVYAMLNFDMIGRMRDSLQVGVTGSTEWRTIVANFNTTGLKTSDAFCTGCTDVACFQTAQRPTLWFFTGLHPEYHLPTDDVALINQDGITRITNLAGRVALHLALTADPLKVKSP